LALLPVLATPKVCQPHYTLEVGWAAGRTSGLWCSDWLSVYQECSATEATTNTAHILNYNSLFYFAIKFF